MTRVWIRVETMQVYGGKMEIGKNARELWNKQRSHNEVEKGLDRTHINQKKKKKERTSQGENSLGEELPRTWLKHKTEKLSLDIKSEVAGDLSKNPLVFAQYLAVERKPHYMV